MKIQLPNGWRPRDYQLDAWTYLENGGKHAELIWARRSGKDEIALHRTACAAFERIATYWHMLPEAAQTRKAIWDAINPSTGRRRIDEAFPRELRETTREQDMMIKFINGSTWQAVGSDNFNSLVGSPPAGIVYSEWALANPNARAYLRPILKENGGWQIFISTPRGNNHAKRTYEAAKSEPGAFAQLLTARDTGAMTEKELAEELRIYIADFGEDAGTAKFEQEYMCSFDAALLGAYYGGEMRLVEQQGRICNVPHDPAAKVFTAWDLGYSDDTGIWWYQIVRGEIHLLEYYGAAGRDMRHYCEQIVGRQITNDDWAEVGPRWGDRLPGLEHRLDYNYAAHNLPHDARAKTLASGGKSIQEMAWLCLGSDKVHIVAGLSIQDGIQAVRSILPRCYFDAERCAADSGGIDALKQYQREWDDGKKCFRERPRHDWTSHCFVGDTEILTRYGMCQIMNLPSNGEVLTLCGWTQYTNPRVTRKNARLVAVEFAGGYSVRCTPDHMFLTESGWKSARSLQKGFLIRSSLTRLHNISMVVYTACGLATNICRAVEKNCIEMFGRLPLVKYQKNVTSIIGTQTLKIIYFRILSVLTRKSICRSVGTQIRSRTKQEVLANQQELTQRHGTPQRKADCGTLEMPLDRSLGTSGLEAPCHVSTALRFSTAWCARVGTVKNIVANLVRSLRTGLEGLTRQPLLVIESVREINETEDVWCLTVPLTGHFSLANGAVVHNCADAMRMLAVAWREEYKDRAPPATVFKDASSMTFNEILAKQKRKNRE